MAIEHVTKQLVKDILAFDGRGTKPIWFLAERRISR
jgi:hypothetical protein